MRKQLRRKRERFYGAKEESENITENTKAVKEKSKRGRKKKDE